MEILLQREGQFQRSQSNDLKTILDTEHDLIWIDLDMSIPAEAEILKTKFQFHQLAIEDVMHQQQRPKVDEFNNHLYIILNPIADIHTPEIFRELHVFVTQKIVVTAHYGSEPIIPQVKHRFEQFHVGFEHQVSYLLYQLLDTMVDAYLPAVKYIETQLDDLSDQVLNKPQRSILNEIFRLRHNLNEIWWVIFPQQDLINTLIHHEEYFIDEKSRYYLRDVADHLTRITNATQSAREMLNSLINLYMSSVSNDLNFAVRRLTLFTIAIGIFAVFSGFYGMNFVNTWPAYEHEVGVPFVLAMMITTTLTIFLIMKWRRWI